MAKAKREVIYKFGADTRGAVYSLNELYAVLQKVITETAKLKTGEKLFSISYDKSPLNGLIADIKDATGQSRMFEMSWADIKKGIIDAGYATEQLERVLDSTGIATNRTFKNNEERIRAMIALIRTVPSAWRAAEAARVRAQEKIADAGLTMAQVMRHPIMQKAMTQFSDALTKRGQPTDEALLNPSLRGLYTRSIQRAVTAIQADVREIEKSKEAKQALTTSIRAYRSKLDSAIRSAGMSQNAFWNDPSIKALTDSVGGKRGLNTALREDEFAARFREAGNAVLNARKEQAAQIKRDTAAEARQRRREAEQAPRMQAALQRASSDAQVSVSNSLRLRGINENDFWKQPEIVQLMAKSRQFGKTLDQALGNTSFAREFGQVTGYVIASMKRSADAAERAAEADRRRAIASGNAATRLARNTQGTLSTRLDLLNESYSRATGTGAVQRFWGDSRITQLLGGVGATSRASDSFAKALGDPQFAREFREIAAHIIREMRAESREATKAKEETAKRWRAFAQGKTAMVAAPAASGVATLTTDRTIPAAQVTKNLREQMPLMRDADKLQKSIVGSLAQTAINMGKWLVFYRLVRDAMMVVETAIRTTVRLGLEYTKSLETQQLGLRATLAENYKVIDANKQTVTGAEKLVALQAVSKMQWQELQAASLAVVGQTQDLMMLYSSIIPYAGRLEASLGDVQRMTKATAVAASLMDINFSDARTAIVSLLQGRSQQRNRLVTLLGISTEELSMLKGTPQLFTRVQQALTPFLDVADEAQGTLSALGESFQEFVGMASRAAEAPFVAGFKQFVRAIQEMMFVGDISDKLVLKPEVSAAFTELGRAMSEAVQPLRDFFTSLKESGGDYTYRLIYGIRNIVAVFAQLATWLLQLGQLVTQFASSYGPLLVSPLVKWAVGILAVVTGLTQLSDYLGKSRNPITVFIRSLVAMKTATDATSASTQGLATKTTLLTTALGRVKTAGQAAAASLRALGASLLAGGAWLAFIALISTAIGKLYKLYDAASRAKQAQLRLREQEPLEAMGITSEERRSDDIATASLTQIQQIGGIQESLGQRLSKSGLAGSESEVRARLQKLIDTQKDAQKKLSDYNNSILLIQAAIEKSNRGELKLSDADLAAKRSKLSALESERQNARNAASQAKTEVEAAENELTFQIEAWAQAAADRKALENKIQAEQRKRDEAAASIETQRKSGRVMWIRSEDDPRSKDEAAALQNATTRAEHLKKIIDEAQTRAQSLRAIWEEVTAATIVPGEQEPIEGPEKGQYQSDLADRLKMIRDAADGEQRVLRLKQKERERLGQETEVTARETNDRLLEIEAAYFLQAVELRDKDLAARRKHEESTVGGKEKPAAARARERELEKYRIAMLADNRSDQARLEELSDEEADRRHQRNLDRTEEEKQAWLDFAQFSAEVYGDAADKIEARIDRFKKKIEDNKKIGPDERERLLGAYGRITDPAATQARLSEEYKSSERTLRSVTREQSALNEAYENGNVPVSSYISRTNELRKSQLAVLTAMLATARAQQQMYQPSGAGKLAVFEFDPEKLDDANQRVSELRAQIEALDGPSQRIAGAFQAWASIIGSIQTMMGDVGKQFSSVFSVLTNGGAAFGQILKQLDTFRVKFNELKEVSGGSSLKAFFGMFGTSDKNTLKPGDEGYGVLKSGKSGIAGIIKSYSGAIGLGISAVFAIGSSIFKSNVEKAKKDMTDSFKKITDAMKDGGVGLGDTVQELEKERARIYSQYSQSKSGRKALDELLPGLDDQIAELKRQQKDVAKSFEDSLRKLSMGKSVYGDFARELIEAESMLNNYLSSVPQFKPDGTTLTNEYIAALAKVHQYWDLMMEQSLLGFKEQLLGFEQEALASQERVFSLMDEQKALYEQLRSLDRQREDLDEQAAELAEDRQQRELDIAEARIELAKKEADIQKQIADIIKKAAEDEAAIRRRGILEAEMSIAEQKAMEIRDVRTRASEQIDDLREQLADLKKDKTLKNLEKQEKNLDKQQRQLEEAKRQWQLDMEKIAQDMRLNQIRLGTAQRVAQIEGSVFGMARDRYDLAERQGRIEVQMADAQVVKWQQTQKLVESIIKTASGYQFDPPEGFPLLTITVGDITIDNSNNQTGGGDGSGGGGGGGENDPREPRPRPGRPAPGRGAWDI